MAWLIFNNKLTNGGTPKFSGISVSAHVNKCYKAGKRNSIPGTNRDAVRETCVAPAAQENREWQNERF